MLPLQWKEAVEQWAEANLMIASVAVFGSRARGGHRNDSDLDLAIKLTCPSNKRLAKWIVNKGRWTLELQNSLPVRVQLEGGDHPEISSADLLGAIQKDQVILYTRT